MKLAEIVSHPIDSFRTAPIALTGIIASSGMSSLMIETASEVQGSDELLSCGATGITAGLALRGIQLTVRSFRFRDKLEASLDSSGFNERYFSKTIGDWCTRQTAIVACEQFDEKQSYLDLFEQSKDIAKFKWLPHL